MKRLSLLILLFASLTSMAQSPCAGKHRIFDVPSGTVPKIITKLGTAPQFHPLRHNKTTAEYFKNLKNLVNDKNYKDEINALFTAIGYNGVSDPAFTIEDVTPAQIPFGAIGMLGGGHHHYVYNLIALTNQPYAKGWKITRKSGDCDLYFMDECGNAFNYVNQCKPSEEKVVEKVKVVEKEKIIEKCTGTAKVKVEVYARYYSKDDCATYEDGYDKCNPKMVAHEALVTEQLIEPIPITAKNAEPPVQKMYLTVDKNTYKKLTGEKRHHCADESCDGSCGQADCDGNHEAGCCAEKAAGCEHGEKPSCEKKCADKKSCEKK